MAAIDTEEQIKKCLDCKKPRCNNCAVIPKAQSNAKNVKKQIRGSFTEAEFYRLYNLGYDDFKIAETLGVPRQNITTYRNRRKLKVNKYCRKGEKQCRVI